MQSVIDFLLGHSIAVHWALLLAEASATAAVGLGIIWESPKPAIMWEAAPYRRGLVDLAHKLVIWGIVFETLFSVSLFVFDEALSNQQQGKIVGLETRLAPRDVKPPETDAIAYRAISHPAPIAVETYMFDAEAGRLATQIVRQLTAAHALTANGSFSMGASNPMIFGIHVTGPDKDLVASLIDWLNESGLQAVDGPEPASTMSAGKPGFNDGKGNPVPTAATIFVGSKPGE